MTTDSAGSGTSVAAPDRGVSTLELFFDLVFVFGITQVTAYLAADHSGAGFVQGLIIIIALGESIVAVGVGAAEFGLGYALPGYAAGAFAVGIVLFLLARQAMWLRAGIPPDPRTWLAIVLAVPLGVAGLMIPAVVTAALGFVVLHVAAERVPTRTSEQPA
jgi:low temperature requirement protein LtrA